MVNLAKEEIICKLVLAVKYKVINGRQSKLELAWSYQW